jgi:outer membrane protein OmpA-like peptidoglycan-associated protein
VLAGIPAATTEPATPKPAPQVIAAFVPGSAVLRPESSDALRALAARRGGGPVAILGGGDARSAQPDAQAAALPLAWRRARAIEDALVAAGVPASAMHVDAAALARGGVARLVD